MYIMHVCGLFHGKPTNMQAYTCTVLCFVYLNYKPACKVIACIQPAWVICALQIGETIAVGAMLWPLLCKTQYACMVSWLCSSLACPGPIFCGSGLKLYEALGLAHCMKCLC